MPGAGLLGAVGTRQEGAQPGRAAGALGRPKHGDMRPLLQGRRLDAVAPARQRPRAREILLGRANRLVYRTGQRRVPGGLQHRGVDGLDRFGERRGLFGEDLAA